MGQGARTEPVLLFDLDSGGHHAGYLDHAIRLHGAARSGGAGARTGPPLAVVVGADFPERHPDVAARAAAAPGVELIAVGPEEMPGRGRPLPGGAGQVQRAFEEWATLCRHARRLSARHAVVMYADGAVQVPLALGLRAPCPISGIFFRPRFHYASFEGARPDARERLHALRQRALLWRALRHPDLRVLFTLDPLAVAPITRLCGRGRVVHLADPVEAAPAPTEAVRALRDRLRAGRSGSLLLLFGVITERKGFPAVLEALEHLPDAAAEETTVALVGPVAAHSRAALEQAVARARARSRVAVVVHDAFVRDGDIQAWFEAADVVLAPYERHVGMSAILVRAAAARRPVLAQSYGLMGELTRRYRLGVTAESGSPTDIARALRALLAGAPDTGWDPEAMARFARENTPERFVQTLFAALDGGTLDGGALDGGAQGTSSAP